MTIGAAVAQYVATMARAIEAHAESVERLASGDADVAEREQIVARMQKVREGLSDAEAEMGKAGQD
jgi:hypothetical protein